MSYVSSRCWYFKSAQEDGAPQKCPSPCTYPTNGEIDKCVYEKGYYGWIYKQLSKDEMRNAKIIQLAVEAAKEHPWMIVLTHLKDHAKALFKEISAATGTTPVFLATGPPMKAPQRKLSVESYREKGGILVATSGVIGEGFDAPKTSCLLRAMPSGGKVSVRQHTGRIMRPQEKKGLILDMVDHRIPWLHRLWLGRRSIYHSIGFTKEEKASEPELFS